MAVRLGLIQMNCSAERKVNLDRAETLVREAARGGAQVVLLPEVFHEFFFIIYLDMKYFESAEPIPGPITERMQALARELGIVIVAPIYERVDRSVYYNSAVVIDADGQILGTYRKNHIPLSTLFYEKLYFKPGNLGYPVWDTSVGRVGIMICYDRHFPEPARALGLKGAELVFNPSATVKSLSRYLWELEQPAHAVANGFWIGAINRVGVEKPLNDGQFYGSSYFCDPRGRIVAKASETEDEVLVADLDLEMIREVRNTWQFLRDRRPETYDELVGALP